MLFILHLIFAACLSLMHLISAACLSLMHLISIFLVLQKYVVLLGSPEGTHPCVRKEGIPKKLLFILWFVPWIIMRRPAG
jgi:hypothetical protein